MTKLKVLFVVKQQNVVVCLRFVKVVKQYTKIQIKNKIFRKYLKLHISFKDKSFSLACTTTHRYLSKVFLVLQSKIIIKVSKRTKGLIH